MKNDLVIRFLDPEMKFLSGDATLTPGFQGVMRDFFHNLYLYWDEQNFEIIYVKFALRVILLQNGCMVVYR